MFRKKALKSEKKLKKKKKGMVDKLIMGGIIGGAIGSVVGMSVAPKTGKDTRKYIKDRSKSLADEYGNDIGAFGKKAKQKGAKVWKFFKKKTRKLKK